MTVSDHKPKDPYQTALSEVTRRIKAQGEQKAKLTLIAEIGNMLKNSGKEMDGLLFDKLFDLSLGELYKKQIILQDSLYNFT